jgi:PAS domain S-box-containing protein
MKFEIGISAKLAGFILAVSIFPLLVVQIVSYRAVLQTRMDVAKSHDTSLLENQLDYLSLQTERIEALVESSAWEKEVVRLSAAAGASSDIQASLIALATQSRIGQILSGYSGIGGLESIDLYDSIGTHYHVGEHSDPLNDNASQYAHQLLIASQSPGKTLWLGVDSAHTGLLSRRPMLVAVKSIYKRATEESKPELLGMVRTNFSTEYLYDHFNGLNLGAGAYLMLVDNQGTFLYHPNKTFIGQPLPSNFAQLLVGLSGSITIRLGDDNVLLSHLQLPEKKWTLISVTPYSTVIAPLRPVWQVSIALLIASLLGIAWFTRLYMHRVVYPIRDVSNGFRDFQKNRLSPDWRLPKRKAWVQVGELVHWFNVFLDSVQLQRKSSLALEASEARYRGLIGAIPDLIFINQSDGQYLFVHEGTAGILLYPPEFILNRKIVDLLPVGVAEDFMRAIENALDSGELQEIDYSLQIEEKMLHFEARLISTGNNTVISLVRDITERKHLEDKQRIAAIAFESELGMTITDGEHTILQVNKAFTDITGYSAEEVVGRTPRLLSSGYHGTAFYDQLVECLTRDGSWRGEVWNRRKTGDIYPVWLSVTSVRNSEGNIINYVGSLHDISEIKDAQAALNILNQELIESKIGLRAMASQRELRLEMERKHIAREVHDELGQYLTALRMNLSLCNKSYGNLVPELAVELRQMKELVDHVIFGVRNVAANLRPPALDMGLIAAIEWLATDFSGRTLIPCTLNIPSEIIQIDESRAVVFFRVAQESLTNIVRHAQATLVGIELYLLEDSLHLKVRDNGCGFLVSSGGNTKSFGLLGMYERCLALGGKLDINSTPGLGTIVEISIPLNEKTTKETRDDSTAYSR